METQAITFLRDHLDEIVTACAERLKAAAIAPYADLPTEQIAALIRRSVELDLDYLGSGDMTNWKQYHEQIIGQLVKSGRPFMALIETGGLIGTVLEEFIKNQLTVWLATKAQSADKTISKLLRRAGNLRAAAISFTTTQGLQETI